MPVHNALMERADVHCEEASHKNVTIYLLVEQSCHKPKAAADR